MPGRPRDRTIDARILASAAQLLVERGARGASMEAVAKHAGVGKVTVYRRWANRRELLAAALRQSMGVSGYLRGRSVQDNLREILLQLAEAMFSQNGAMAFARVYSEKDAEPELLSAFRECGVWPRRKQIREQLQKGRHEGLVRKDADLDVMVDLFYGACIGRVLSGAKTRGDFVGEVLDILWRGAGVPAPSRD